MLVVSGYFFCFSHVLSVFVFFMGFVGLSVNMDLNTELWAVGAL